MIYFKHMSNMRHDIKNFIYFLEKQEKSNKIFMQENLNEL